jgi:hypothetical protein
MSSPTRISAFDAKAERYLCTWLYGDSAAEQLAHYQVRGDSSSDAFQAIYWRSVALFFATSLRQEHTARHVLFTNLTSLPTVDGVSMASLLDRLEVEVVRLPLTFATPPGYYHQWRNQFYVFDMIHHFARSLDDGDSAVVLDSDCVWVASAEPVWEAIRRDGLLTYVVQYDPEWKNNGLSRRDMSSIAGSLLGRELPHPLVYCGGELLAATGAEFRRLAPEADRVWGQLMERHARGEPVFYEEGQTLSYLYYKLGYPAGNGDPFVRRIFTDALRGGNNASPHDYGLVAWHVPLEKRLGIRRLFARVADETSSFWSLSLDPDFRHYLGAALGVPRNSMRKRVLDLARRSADKATR